MFRVLFLIMFFLVVLYIYTFVKIRRKKKQREKEPNYVEQYHKKHSVQKKTPGRSGYSMYSNGSEIRNYVTKYNSPVDYVEKE